MRFVSQEKTVDCRRLLWTVLLVATSIGFSLGFACAVPLAAFAAIAVLTMPRAQALLLVGATWLANQIVGFSFLHYPWTAECLAWGTGLGLISIAAAWMAGLAAGRTDISPAARIARIMTVFAIAFGVYEGSLFIISIAVGDGVADFAPNIVARIAMINAAAFVGLLAVDEVGKVSGLRPANTMVAREPAL